MRVRQYNKRYFTLDFDSRVFFYAHAENSKKASTVIAFSELLDVRLPESQTAVAACDTTSECSRQSKVSFLKRMSSFSKKDEDLEQHCLSVIIKPDRAMDLVCSDSEELTQWLEALRAAIELGGGSPQHGAGGEGGGSPPGKGAGRGGYPGDGQEAGSSDKASGYGSGRPPLAPAATAAGDGNTSPTSSDGSGAAPAPPAAKRNFLDFGAIEEEKPGDVKDSPTQEATAVSATGLCTLQASDFGFAADDASSNAASSSAPSSPRGAIPTLGDAGAAASKAGAKAASGAAKAEGGTAAGLADASPAGAAAEYKDRHKGLTLQERLNNLEFSDDEDDDEDDPLGLKARGS